jgi:hypothetical protein
MRTCLIALALAGVAGCAVGAPPGFSDGDLWTFPLVAPLEDDLLLVPVYVNDRAEPLLFMIDPDSRQSSIDNALQSELKPYSVQAPEEVTEADSPIPVFVAEIAKIKVGDLEVKNLKMRVHNAGTFFSGGRVVRGILGRDVIAESLVFTADRDRGVAFLATQGSLSPPPGAIEIGFRHYFNRRVTKVVINDKQSFDVHLDIGARTSMLLANRMAKAGLPRVPVRALLVDEYGYKREESSGGLAAKVALGDARVDGVLFLPFGDKRIDDEELQGALGQNFFSRFHMTLNWDKKKAWLKPRSNDAIGTARERVRRWGNLFDKCKNPACVSVQLVRAEAPASPATPAAPATPPAEPATPPASPPAAAPTPAEPGVTSAPPVTPEPAPAAGALKELRILREDLASVEYEVLLEAVDADGKPLGLPRLLAHLPGGIPAVTERTLAPQYSAAAAFVVLDVSPFPRPCDNGPEGRRCVWPLEKRM